MDIPKQKIWIIDYEMGNLKSVFGSFRNFIDTVVLSHKPQTDADKIVIPGVGAFGKGIENLKRLKLLDALYELILERGKLTLGICLGMQIFFERSEESPGVEGLKFIRGEVKSLRHISDKIRIPNIGWAKTYISPNSLLFNKLSSYEYFYYIHSFFVIPQEEVKIGELDSDEIKFVSAVHKNNIFGVQFHPEKSGEKGLKIIENFLKI